MLLWLVHACLAALAFFAVNWLGRHAISSGYYQISFIADADDAPAFNTVFRVLAPLVFSVLTAAALYALSLDNWVVHFYRVTILYFGLRWGFNIVMGRRLLLQWPRQIFIAVASISAAALLYDRVLRHRKNVLPDPATLANELWVVVLLFLYATFNQVHWSVGPTVPERRKAYIRDRYRVYDVRYGALIREKAGSRLVEAISFAILIYESFNRPPVYQWLERNVLYPLRLSRSLGPMQVQVDQRIDDREGVARGVAKILGSVTGAEANVRKDYSYWGLEHDIPLPKGLYPALAREIAGQYNIRSDYPREVAGIFEELVESEYKDLKPAPTSEEGLG